LQSNPALILKHIPVINPFTADVAITQRVLNGTVDRNQSNRFLLALDCYLFKHTLWVS